MKPNGFQVFQVMNTGIVPVLRNGLFNLDNKMTAAEDSVKLTLEEAEASIKIPRDLMGDRTYVILPVYTNKLPEAK